MKYYIIAGEASGDLHASNLMKGLSRRDPEAKFRFWGGDMMAAVGGTLVHHYREGAVMGLTDVLAKAGKLLGNIRLCKQDILAWKPDAVILVDYPGFNLRIAGFCHSHGIRTFYYIAPKTWASRARRNRKLKAWVDKLFIVFPFEKDYFDKVGIPYIYEGNPLIDAVDSHEFIRPVEESYIALLPGSRKGEISRMMPVCMEAADMLGCRIVVAGAPSRDAQDYLKFIGGRSNVSLVFGRTYDVLKFADAAVINSGTASLEAALIGTPQVVCWSSSAATVWAARHILHVGNFIKYISLGNLIIDKPAFRELIQEDFNAGSVAGEVECLIGDESRRSAMLADYALIRKALGGRGASERVAEAMIREIKNHQI